MNTFCAHPLTHPSPLLHGTFSPPIPHIPHLPSPPTPTKLQTTFDTLLEPLGWLYLFYVLFVFAARFIDPRRYRGLGRAPGRWEVGVGVVGYALLTGRFLGWWRMGSWAAGVGEGLREEGEMGMEMYYLIERGERGRWAREVSWLVWKYTMGVVALEVGKVMVVVEVVAWVGWKLGVGRMMEMVLRGRGREWVVLERERRRRWEGVRLGDGKGVGR
ncbi:hypothetical protein EX30DRAFT_397737 [Ascodesmis nigricans]|uniref:Uncharacterized protein n=1 Tax=Ascodesmis nigricans TaxID=341454 RepID=A0A4S2MN76_9PEZI|nr:hypothetical protein EX30DRAFT_397737 [Ascodesmis nigricans]